MKEPSTESLNGQEREYNYSKQRRRKAERRAMKWWYINRPRTTLLNAGKCSSKKSLGKHFLEIIGDFIERCFSGAIGFE